MEPARKGFSAGLLVPAFIFLLTACSPAPTPTATAEPVEVLSASTNLPAAEPSTTPKPQKIKISVNPYTSYSPIFIAEEEGYFKEQGLEVEYVTFTTASDTSSIALLQSRELDVAGQGPSSGVFNAVAASPDLKIVADRGYLKADGCAPLAMLAKTEWAAQNPTLTLESIKGKRMSIDPKNFSAWMFEKVLDPAGISLADIETGDIKTPELMAAVETGAVDFITTGEPWITRIADTGKMVVWQEYQKIVPDMQVGFMMFGPSITVDDRELGRKFLVAYLKGVRQFNRGKTDRNVEIIAKYTKLDPELLRRVCWTAIHGSGEINLNALLEFQDWGVENGWVGAPVTGEQLWDPEFAAFASNLLGPEAS
jgi:NitT/TauT family transport system substrate-binding protein